MSLKEPTCPYKLPFQHFNLLADMLYYRNISSLSLVLIAFSGFALAASVPGSPTEMEKRAEGTRTGSISQERDSSFCIVDEGGIGTQVGLAKCGSVNTNQDQWLCTYFYCIKVPLADNFVSYWNM